MQVLTAGVAAALDLYFRFGSVVIAVVDYFPFEDFGLEE